VIGKYVRGTLEIGEWSERLIVGGILVEIAVVDARGHSILPSLLSLGETLAPGRELDKADSRL
jgi:hypothetical protein